MLAIHNSKEGFHPRWIAYCEEKGIPFKLVDCHANNLLQQLNGCKALMWHHSHSKADDIVIAKQLLFALEHLGIPVFPDFKTNWHFDDKLGQKYLMDGLNVPTVPSYGFFTKASAFHWIQQTTFPKVFKLRGGAGSANVKLVRSSGEARRMVTKAFSKGFKNYAPWVNLMERFRKFREGKVGIMEPVKGFVRLFKPPLFSKVMGREVGYAYFQDFIPNNQFDIRIVVIDEKAFALKRFVRKNDFRASGSGSFAFGREEFDERCVEYGFLISAQLGLQCGVYDFVFDEQNVPLLVEISYGYSAPPYDECPGYWDRQLQWHEGKYNHEGWMVDLMLKY